MNGIDAYMKGFNARKSALIKEIEKIDGEIEEASKILLGKPKNRIQAALLTEAEKLEAQYLVQIDAKNVLDDDPQVRGDEDNDCITLQQRWDLRDSEGIRIQFEPELDSLTVLRLLNKICLWLIKDLNSNGVEKPWGEFKMERFNQKLHPDNVSYIRGTSIDDDLPF